MRILVTLLIALGVMALCFGVLTRTSYIWLIQRARRRGLYPTEGRPTLEDVKKLLRANERYLAVRVYQAMHRLTFRQAQLEVDLLERNMKKQEV